MNFYKENPALKFQLSHPLMEKIVALKERNYEDKDKYDYLVKLREGEKGRDNFFPLYRA